MALEQWIRERDQMGRPASIKLIEQTAQEILTRNAPDPSDPPVLSKMWIYRYIKRLPDDLHKVKQNVISRKRFEVKFDKNQFIGWFDELQYYVRYIPPRNIYNFDETGFVIGDGKAQNVITAYPTRTQSTEAPTADERESVMVIETIAANGDILPPYFIFKGEVHMERWYRVDGLPGDYGSAVSPKGYTTDQLALDWLKHFISSTCDRTKKGEDRVLLFDGHGSHMTFEFLTLCHTNNIIPFCFIPHSTHFAQPLDGNPFLAYKHHFRARNTAISSWGGLTNDKTDFLREITKNREKTFK